MITYDFTWFGIHMALNALLLLLLGVNVSRLRMKLKIAYGDGNDVAMSQAIRAHGNGVEQVTVFSLVLLALTFVGTANGFLAIVVLGFFVARMLHGFGMLKRNFTARRIGAGLTFLTQAVVGVVLLIAVFGG